MRNKHLGIEVDKELHYKLHYIAKYEGRSGNGQIIYSINDCIRKFEKEHVIIESEENNKKNGLTVKSDRFLNL